MLRRVVLIGATGFFGRRLAHKLAQIDGIELVLTSRSEARSRALAGELEGGANVLPIAFDRDDADTIERLRALGPWAVIDTSGPFQATGYDLAHAAIAAGAHWIDLADAHDYLLGFEGALDKLAREKGVTARAGASSTPALSMAVVDELTRNWRRIDSIDIAILPGGKGDVGEAVIRAILSYSGKPISTFAEGRLQTITGWGSARLAPVAGLGSRYVSPVETADASLMPSRFGVASRVSFGAGLESRLEQFGLLLLARLTRRGLISDLQPMASLLARSRALTRLDKSDYGGMSIDCRGLDGDGLPTSAHWVLRAMPGQGPDVPVLPALALVRALLRGDVESGGEIATLALGHIEAEMTSPALTTSRVVRACGGESLIAAACGADYAELPDVVKAFHDPDAPPVWDGKADIDTSNSLAARIVRRIFGFPPPGRSIDVTVTVERGEDHEIWTRNFGGNRFFSRLQHEGSSIVSERFGPFRILLRLEVNGGEIRMPVVGWRVGRINLPLALAPKSETREFRGEDGRFHFDVLIRLPLIGPLVHYRGWLEARTTAAPETPGVAMTEAASPIGRRNP